MTVRYDLTEREIVHSDSNEQEDVYSERKRNEESRRNIW